MLSGLIVISAPHFVAGAVYSYGVVIRSAPILRYMTNWTVRRVIEYADRKHWMVEIYED